MSTARRLSLPGIGALLLALSATHARAGTHDLELRLPLATVSDIAAGPQPRQVELRWQPSPDSDVVRYRIYLGAASHSYDTVVPVESFSLQNGVAVAVLSGIDNAARYLALTALDAGGQESVYSNELLLAAACQPAACDDQNPCTADSCTPNGCAHAPAPDGTTCSDADPMTAGDVCRAGSCAGTLICTAASCDDQNPCTADSCTANGCAHAPAPDGTTCSDADPMTAGDVCRAGSCAGTLICTAASCDDQNPCTTDSCTANGCAHAPAPDGTTCSDADPTTTGDVCRGGSCAGEVPPPPGRRFQVRWQLSPDADVVAYRIYLGPRSGSYDMLVPVESSAADPAGAVAVLYGVDDAVHYVVMTAVDRAGQESVYSNELRIDAACSAAACADTNPCTVDACGPSGCTHALAPDGTTCDDGDAGTLNDACRAGSCMGELPPPAPACTPAACSDGDPCTQDSCGTSGCTNTPVPNGSACNDGDPATLGDMCQAGVCAGALPLPPGRQVELRWQPSPDSDVVRYRIYLGGASHSYDTVVPVESFSLQNGVAVAVLAGLDNAAHYVALSALDGGGQESVLSNELRIDAACSADACADANPCTLDACSPSGCSHLAAADGGACSDGDPGTVNDSCRAGLCVGALPHPTAPAADDLNADGFSDLLALDPASGDLAALLVTGGGAASVERLSHPLPAGDWAVVARADFDGNGSADLVFREQTRGANGLWLLDGSQVIASLLLPSEPDLAWKIVHAGDLDGDGRADLVWYHTGTRALAAWRLDGARVVESRFLGSSPSSDWVPVAGADLQGDHMHDVVWRNVATGANAAWLMSSARVTASVFLPSLPPSFALAATGDLDGDGRTDLVWRDAASGAVRAWLMDGSSVRAALELPALVGAELRAIGTGDYDGDGANDILWHDPATGESWLWSLNGQGGVSSQAVSLAVPPGTQLLPSQPDVLALLGLH